MSAAAGSSICCWGKSRMVGKGGRLMLKAIVKHGAIVPLEPLPPDWREGTTLQVDATEELEPSRAEIDRFFDELDRLCADADPGDAARIDAAVREANELDKTLMRRQMELPE